MPQNIDINTLGTPSQLSYMFNSGQDPQSVMSDLFLKDSRLAQWATDSSRAAGWGNDPATHFKQQQQNMQMAQTQQQEEAAQLAGYDRRTSPEGIHRMEFQKQLDQNNAVRTSQAAALDAERRNREYPLSAPGQDQYLSPLAADEAKRLGMDPREYVDRKRSGASMPSMIDGVKYDRGSNSDNLIPTNQKQNADTPYNPNSTNPLDFIPAGTNTAVNPKTLFDDKRFQSHIQAQPDHAKMLFKAWTGMDMGEYQAQATTMHKENREDARKFVGEKVDTGELRQRKDKTWERREMAWTNMGGVPTYAPTGKYIEPSDTDKEKLNLIADDMFPRQAALDAAEKEKAAALAASKAADDHRLATGNHGGPMVPAKNQEYIYNSSDRADLLSRVQELPDSMRSIAWPVMGSNWVEKGLQNAIPIGNNPAHVRSLLQNDPHFQQKMQDDPQGARETIVKLQRAKGVNPLTGLHQ